MSAPRTPGILDVATVDALLQIVRRDPRGLLVTAVDAGPQVAAIRDRLVAEVPDVGVLVAPPGPLGEAGLTADLARLRARHARVVVIVPRYTPPDDCPCVLGAATRRAVTVIHPDRPEITHRRRFCRACQARAELVGFLVTPDPGWRLL